MRRVRRPAVMARSARRARSEIAEQHHERDASSSTETAAALVVASLSIRP